MNSKINSDSILNNYNEPWLQLHWDVSVEEATNRVFVVGREFILSDLKKLSHSFGLKLNFCTTISSSRITCNRADCQELVKKALLRNDKSVTCGCGWYIRFRCINSNNNKVSDPVIITYICRIHSNICDPSYVDQFDLTRIYSSNKKHCADQYLKKMWLDFGYWSFCKE